MPADHIEYRERSLVWQEDGTVEMYCSQARDYNSLLTRLRHTSVKPLAIEELRPGYGVVLRGEDIPLFHKQPRLPRPKPTLSPEVAAARAEHMRKIRHSR